jgi:ribose 5-phosphate isomerase RpiB
MRVGIAADHGGFELKAEIADAHRTAGHEVVDFGARILTSGDDYPDYCLAWRHGGGSASVTTTNASPVTVLMSWCRLTILTSVIS